MLTCKELCLYAPEISPATYTDAENCGTLYCCACVRRLQYYVKRILTKEEQAMSPREWGTLIDNRRRNRLG